jgi:hypothetical protein
MVAVDVALDTLLPVRAQIQSPARVPWPVVVDELANTLGVGLVALMANSARETVSRWRSGAQTRPNTAAEMRLREAYRICRDLERADSRHTIRAWFMGTNHLLDDQSPAEAIAAGQFRAALAAARAFRDE